VEETVMLLEGEATVVVGDATYELAAGEVTWVPADVPHFFKNRGAGTMRIYWVYLGQEVTRTIVATGETFEHLSEADRNLATKPES
jgi:mannose-6-phosphate isomerase-like protein (cupin superfamily)